MKKILALAIVAVMTVALFAVGAHAEDASVQQSNFDAVNATGPDLQFYGWVIIKGDDTISDIGYRIDSKDPVFSSLKDRSAEVSGVIGSDPAKTNGFDVRLSTNDIPAGEHVLHVVLKTAGGALLDVNQGSSDGFKVVGTGPEETAAASLGNKWIDGGYAQDGKDYCRGWVFINDGTIDVFGYRIDDGNPVFDAAYEQDRSDVWEAFGGTAENSNGFEISVDISKVAKGDHTITFAVKTCDGQIFDLETKDFTSNYEGEPEPQQPDNPGTADASVIAIAAVACVALAGVVIAKKVK